MERSMNKIVLKRTLRFWSYYVERMLAVLIGLVLFYSFIFNRNHVDDKADLLLIALGYMVMMGSVMMLIMPMSYTSGCIPMILSMGASRKEALLGMQFAGIAMAGQLCLMSNVGFAYVRSFANSDMMMQIDVLWKLLNVLWFAVLAIGQFGAVLQMRFGAKGSVTYTIIAVVLFVAVGMVCGFAAGRAAASDSFDAVALLGNLQNVLNIVCVIAVVVSVVLYVIAYRLQKKVIMKYEVYR